MHLLLRYEEVAPPNWRLAVIDLESTNGTEVERWAGHGSPPSRPVPTDKELFLSGKDRLVLGGTVQLRLSGRRFVTDTPGQSVPPGQVTLPADRLRPQATPPSTTPPLIGTVRPAVLAAAPPGCLD